MKKLLLPITVALLMFSCAKHQPKFAINGTLPSKEYDGETIYLTPAMDANKSNVDSTIIRDGKFTITGDTERVSILRMKPMLRMKIQEILVVTEAGNVQADLGPNSIGGGTPQNELLQQWKEQVMRCNKDFAMMQAAKIDSTNETDIKAKTEKYNMSDAALKTFTLEIIHKHKGTTLQKFLSNITGER